MKGSGLVTALCLASSPSSTAAFSTPPISPPPSAHGRRSRATNHKGGAIVAAVHPGRGDAPPSILAVGDDDDARNDEGSNRRCRSRCEFLSVACNAIVVLSTVTASSSSSSSSYAADLTSTTTTTTTAAIGAPGVGRSIGGCDVDRDDCVSTANIRDAKGSYSPPWTFETSPDEAFARIKGVLASDDSYVVTEIDENARYVRAYARRLASDDDEVEFLVRADDNVVLYRSTARRNGSVSDFGANRRRIDDVRRRGAVFGIMGDGMTADSYDGGGAASRGNNPWGQLKAFYGLQSGEGFEAVFEDEE